jgi:LPXTG-motif cell wall-anchored protein
VNKSVAALSAAVLGVGAAATGGAVSAGAAAPTPDPALCGFATEHQTAPPADIDAHWYMECTPKYGMAKVEFTLTSGEDFPAGFDLDNAVESGSANLADSSDYFSHDGYDVTNKTGLFELSTPAPVGTKSQHYSALAALPITSVEAYTGSIAGCAAGARGYDHVYRINYANQTTTFKQKVGGKAWNFSVPVHSDALILALNFAADGTLDGTRAQCAIVGGSTAINATDDTDPNWNDITQDRATRDFPETLVPFVNRPEDLGTVARTPVPSTPVTPTADPELAATGVSPVPAGIAAGSLLAAAGAFFVIGRRRRTARKH